MIYASIEIKIRWKVVRNTVKRQQMKEVLFANRLTVIMILLVKCFHWRYWSFPSVDYLVIFDEKDNMFRCGRTAVQMELEQGMFSY